MTEMKTGTPVGFDAGADVAAAGGSTSHPGLPASTYAFFDDVFRGPCTPWTVDGHHTFGQTRAWALERASDLLLRAECARARECAPDPQDMTFAYAWIAYANACRDVEARS